MMCLRTVSYTHLDVYKRQLVESATELHQLGLTTVGGYGAKIVFPTNPFFLFTFFFSIRMILCKTYQGPRFKYAKFYSFNNRK